MDSLKNDIVDAIWPLHADINGWDDTIRPKYNELLGIEGEDDRKNRKNRRNKKDRIDNGLSVLAVEYCSSHDRYVDRVKECVGKFTTLEDYIGVVKKIEMKRDEDTGGWTLDVDNICNAFSHNAAMREGRFQCDDKTTSAFVWMAFNDAINIVGEMALFTIQMRAYLKTQRIVCERCMTEEPTECRAVRSGMHRRIVVIGLFHVLLHEIIFPSGL